MDKKQLDELLAADWPAITAKVLKSALFMALKYGWDANSSLPNGQSVEDVVLEAVSDLWGEPDRIRCDLALTTQLTGMVRSKLWNLSQSADEDVARAETMEEVAVERRKSGENTVDDLEEAARALELVSQHPKVKGKADHELVLAAIACGVTEVEEIVTETQLSRDRVYQVRRELREIFPSVANQLRIEREGRASV